MGEKEIRPNQSKSTDQQSQHKPFPPFPTVDYVDKSTPHGKAQGIYFEMLDIAKTVHGRVLFDADKQHHSGETKYQLIIQDGKESKRKPERLRPRDVKNGRKNAQKVGPGGIKLKKP